MSCFDVKKRVGQTDERGVYSSVVFDVKKRVGQALRKGDCSSVVLVARSLVFKPLEGD